MTNALTSLAPPKIKVPRRVAPKDKVPKIAVPKRVGGAY